MDGTINGYDISGMEFARKKQEADQCPSALLAPSLTSAKKH